MFLHTNKNQDIASRLKNILNQNVTHLLCDKSGFMLQTQSSGKSRPTLLAEYGNVLHFKQASTKIDRKTFEYKMFFFRNIILKAKTNC